MKYRLRLFLIAVSAFPWITYASTLVQMRTDMGNIDIVLFEQLAPKTVENFLNYVTDGDYDGTCGSCPNTGIPTYIHRSIPGFVVQGGGYFFDENGIPDDGDFFTGSVSHIPEDDPIENEANLPGALSNVRGTMAMAKQPDDPDSAKSEWFFNQVDNTENLDIQNEGFTVYGVATDASMTVVDATTSLPRCIDNPDPLAPLLCRSGVQANGDPFDATYTPFIDPSSESEILPENLVKLTEVGFQIEGDTDGDGVSDDLEDDAPGGDGNNDGTPDSQQAHVASLPGIRGEYITFTITDINGVSVSGASPPARLDSVFVLGPSFLEATKAGNELAGFNFAHGFTGFNVVGATLNDSVNTAVVQITLPAEQSPNQYFQYGPTLDNPAPHWHKFTFDGQTGADFPGGNKLDLYFTDGGPGDSSLGVQDGEIRDPSAGAIAFKAPNASDDSDGGGGCSLRRSDAGIMQAGEWLVLFLMAVIMRIHNSHSRKA